MKFSEIPLFIPGGNYGINVELGQIERFLEGARETGLDLDPDFQRGRVWTESQQVAFVEFTLRGGESSRVIYWNCPDWSERKEPHCDLSGELVIVDGLQRLTAMRKFLAGDIKAFGLRYDEFEGQPRIKQGSLVMKINNLQTRKDLLTWYLELNAGGTVHTEAELDRVRGLLDAEA